MDETKRYYVIKQIGEFLIVVDNETDLIGVKKKDEKDWVINPRFSFIDYYEKDGIFYCVEKSELGVDVFRFLGKNGNQINEDSFDLAYGFFMGVCIVEKGGNMNIINNKCEILSDTWFNTLSYPIIDVDNDKNSINYIIEGTYVGDDKITEFLLKDGKLFKK